MPKDKKGGQCPYQCSKVQVLACSRCTARTRRVSGMYPRREVRKENKAPALERATVCAYASQPQIHDVCRTTDDSYRANSVSELVHRRIRLIRRNNWFLGACVRACVRYLGSERVCTDENRRGDSIFLVQLRTIIDGDSREVIQAQAPGNCMNHLSFHG